ncbi:hypothetical protein PHISCL_03123 [Aspergillus sclerotialis]|uniref:Altered inheritance of mitochondria protein 9, mitochondrial n=1 Tax=Aspergillus sclerotialis TaxID=2070753 RepID=A0A3A2ZND1_9EURO|nr:hypothetical protein PHISCL_03123 [Aspergillus sclerotialis]
MDGGRNIIAKIPHPNAGPEVYTTASEVATMDFARSVLDLPVPKVLAWSATATNPVESEYILMEEAKGSQLHDVWKNLQLRDKRDIIQEIINVEKKMLSISFDRIGSLYFKDSGIPGCETISTTDVAPDIGDTLNSRFSIGPIVQREFWGKGRANMHAHHGPWTSAEKYLKSVAQREIDYIKAYSHNKQAIHNPWLFASKEQNNPEAHISCLHKFLSAVPEIIPKDSEPLSPRFWYLDFHTGNLYVDDKGKISSIIDWQASSILPLFIGPKPPSLLDYNIEMMMKLPDHYEVLDEASKEKLRYQVSQSILIHSYETRTVAQNPLMYKMMRHLHGKTLKHLEAFAGGTWDNCLFPFRECLIRVEREWSDFSDKPCPYHFSDDEVREHREEAAVFNETQDFWKSLSALVTDEGYTSVEDFESVVDIFKQLREAGLSELRGEERNEFERETRWLLDIRN